MGSCILSYGGPRGCFLEKVLKLCVKYNDIKYIEQLNVARHIFNSDHGKEKTPRASKNGGSLDVELGVFDLCYKLRK